MKLEIIISIIGVFLSLLLCFLAFRIHQKSHAIRKRIYCNENEEEIIVNEIVKHFDYVVKPELPSKDYNRLKDLFQKELNSKIHLEMKNSKYKYYDYQIRNSLHNIYFHENVIKNLHYKQKKNNEYFIARYTDLYVDIFKIVLHVYYAKNNKQYFNLKIKEQTFNLPEYKFTVKESEKGIEAISVE